MQRALKKTVVIDARTLSIWLGISGILIAVTAMAFFATKLLFDGAVATNQTTLHEPVQTGLRGSFLLISIGVLGRLRSRLSTQWRWAVGAALAILICAIIGEALSTLVRIEWVADFTASLGDSNSLERRLVRVGAMAAYAVPMLALLAAAEYKQDHVVDARHFSARAAGLLVSWEPVLFAIGASTLASILIMAAFVHKEITWLSPIGADTAVAACVAAAIRARWRADSLAFGGWFVVCVSMAIGLLMGSYSFGGPAPTPALIGEYDTLIRTLLRNGHVMLMCIGVIGIAIAATRQPQEGVI